MAQDTGQTLAGTLRLTFTVLGVGLLVSLLAGLLIGWITGDVGYWIGRAVAIGMGITAVVGVAANLLTRRR